MWWLEQGTSSLSEGCCVFLDHSVLTPPPCNSLLIFVLVHQEEMIFSSVHSFHCDHVSVRARRKFRRLLVCSGMCFILHGGLWPVKDCVFLHTSIHGFRTCCSLKCDRFACAFVLCRCWFPSKPWSWFQIRSTMSLAMKPIARRRMANGRVRITTAKFGEYTRQYHGDAEYVDSDSHRQELCSKKPPNPEFSFLPEVATCVPIWIRNTLAQCFPTKVFLAFWGVESG